MKPYTTGLLGLGKIASSYGNPGEEAPYCHAGGVAQCDSTVVTAAADPFPAARTAFLELWGPSFAARGVEPQTYDSALAMLEGSQPDIVAVCVRGPMHFEAVQGLLMSPHRPRVIFLEKPPFCSLQEADAAVALAKDKGVTLVVSYSRHWAAHVLRMEQLIGEGLIGKVHTVVGYCGGGVLSFASHTTELICQMASAGVGSYHPTSVRALLVPGGAVPQPQSDLGYEEEPVVRRLVVEFANGVTGIQVGRDGEHGGFYADVYGERGRARVGMYLKPAAWDEHNKPIDLEALGLPENRSVFCQAYGQIARFLDGGPEPDCSGANWEMVNEVGFGAIESHAGGGVPVALPLKARNRLIWANG